ncbi:hypothetical protein [Flavipsychrobacter stenotrophus]|nr:hypothetical protein [Flavipsychrobacter stenotrophus]
MKKLLLIAPFALLFFYSCKKGPADTIRATAPYQLNNLHDYLVTNDAVNTTDVAFTLGDADEGDITVVPVNLPAGVTITPTSITVQTTDSFRFTVTSTLPVSGSYPIKLRCSALYRKDQTFTFNLVSGTDLGIPLVGAWTCHDSSSNAFLTGTYSATITRAGPNQVNVNRSGRTIHCHLNGLTGTVITDAITAAYSYTAGTGTFSNSQIILDYMTYPNYTRIRSTLTR